MSWIGSVAAGPATWSAAEAASLGRPAGKPRAKAFDELTRQKCAELDRLLAETINLRPCERMLIDALTAAGAYTVTVDPGSPRGDGCVRSYWDGSRLVVENIDTSVMYDIPDVSPGQHVTADITFHSYGKSTLPPELQKKVDEDLRRSMSSMRDKGFDAGPVPPGRRTKAYLALKAALGL
ncbi:hypothetical protein [Piscinibacter gummiphilus]|uniref:Uncharacterized protein n=1 Tax=Piscinibacter gummiphilus TaxID=946333 RepID=A0ABZ0CND1_9BURK|nr:hypothetical protein [Piscinibacter gummiphilus]WOB06483.1 hypothetical protein RXV79_16295 [Piscinibacter gummiphilus]